MSYSVMDIASYIINYGIQRGYGISNLKLQKILYFVQVDFLTNTKTKEPCFLESIEAWSFGPVIPVVYQAFKGFGNASIMRVDDYIDFSTGIWNAVDKRYEDINICAEDKKRIELMTDKCSQYSASQLVDITHRQNPWKEAYIPYQNNQITVESIKEYFNE